MKRPSGWQIVKPSTKIFYREGRQTPGYSLWDWVHGYVYARWPYLYISIATGEHRLSKLFAPMYKQISRILAHLKKKPTGKRVTFADTYHGKVVPLEAAAHLVTVGEEIRLTNLEKVIPYAKAREIILKNPDHILVLECPCRAARLHPCLPLEVCLIIGDPFASFVEEHHPRRSRRITPAQAVEILEAEDERGHVHHAFFKDAMLGRFYAICNCCECCCGAMQAHQHGTPMLASSGYICQVDETRCINCGECRSYCQFGALTGGEGFSKVDQEACMGCGVCTSKCSQGALSLVLEPSRGIPLEIEALMSSV